MNNFGNFLKTLEEDSFTLKVEGYFNIEGGSFSVGTDYFDFCDCLSDAFGQNECADCPRRKSNRVSFASGDGDGIYVAASIRDEGSNGRPVGLLAVFDYQYQMATEVRNLVNAERAPEYPIELASQFSEAVPLKIGTLSVGNELLIGDSNFSNDSNYAVVRIPGFKVTEFECYIFLQRVDSTPEATVERLHRTQGIDRTQSEMSVRAASASFDAIAEYSGIAQGSNPFPDYIPRAIVVLESSLEKLKLISEVEIPDWNLFKTQLQFGSVGTAHREPMHVSVVWQNVLLAREIDRAAGDCDNATAKALLFDMMTWLYQGQALGDKECVDLLSKINYQPSAQELAELKRRRGMTPHKANPSTESAASQSNSLFCSQCGAKLKTDAKFCSICGNQVD